MGMKGPIRKGREMEGQKVMGRKFTLLLQEGPRQAGGATGSSDGKPESRAERDIFYHLHRMHSMNAINILN